MNQHRNAQWDLGRGELTWEKASIAVLMDIRTELQTLNHLLACPNFIAIPKKLDAIRRNTNKKPRKKVKP